MVNPVDPYQLLAEIEQRTKNNAFGLPARSAAQEVWRGVAFRLGQARLVTSLGQIREILVFPRASSVPGAKRWVRGLANVRGKLLPIMDLRGFLLGEAIPLTRRSRVLVIEQAGTYSGLLVDEVLGLKNFPADSLSKEPSSEEEAIRGLLSGSIVAADEQWGVFDMSRLVECPEFMQVAA